MISWHFDVSYLILGDEQYIEMNVGIIQKDRNGLSKEGDEDWSADSEPDSPPSPGKVTSDLTQLLKIVLSFDFWRRRKSTVSKTALRQAVIYGRLIIIDGLF